MVRVRFIRNNREVGEITVGPGDRVRAAGDVSWLDYDLVLDSRRLGRSVSFAEDPEEWARSLPDGLKPGDLVAIVDELPVPAPPRLVIVGGSGAAGRGRRPRPVLLVALIVVLIAAVALVAVNRKASAAQLRTPTPPSGQLAPGAAASGVTSTTTSAAEGRLPRSSVGAPARAPTDPNPPYRSALSFRNALATAAGDCSSSSTAAFSAMIAF